MSYADTSETSFSKGAISVVKTRTESKSFSSFFLLEHNCIWEVKTCREETIAYLNLVLFKVEMKGLAL